MSTRRGLAVSFHVRTVSTTQLQDSQSLVSDPFNNANRTCLCRSSNRIRKSRLGSWIPERRLVENLNKDQDLFLPVPYPFVCTPMVAVGIVLHSSDRPPLMSVAKVYRRTTTMDAYGERLDPHENTASSTTNSRPLIPSPPKRTSH